MRWRVVAAYVVCVWVFFFWIARRNMSISIDRSRPHQKKTIVSKISPEFQKTKEGMYVPRLCARMQKSTCLLGFLKCFGGAPARLE